MADEKPLDVIAVGAHPDDVEIACGGTLAKLVKQGYRVGIVDLTDGEPTPNSPGPEARAAEAEAARKKLGVHVRVQLDLPNRRQVIPLVATSKDGTSQRTVVLAVERNTKQLEPLIHEVNE